MRRVWALVCILLPLGLLAACSSPLDEDDSAGAQDTLVATSQPTENATTELPSATAPATEAISSDSVTESPETLMAATPTSPRATASSGATPSPTAEPLPEDGAELLIEGDPITRIIPGSVTGRTMYAHAGGILYRTNDGGLTWSQAGEGEFGPITVAINEPNVIYSGDKGGCGRGFSFHPFTRSSDAGHTWQTVETNGDIQPLLAYETQNAALVYGTSCGLEVSTDGGDTWRRIVDLNGEEIFVVTTERSAPMRQLLVVGATEGGTGRLFLFDSADPGNPQFVSAVAQFWGNAAVDWNDGRIVVAHAHQVGVSDDGGETWEWTRDGLENATYSSDPLFEGIPQDEDNPFRGFEFARIDPGNRDRIWIAGNRGAYLSIDGGQSWSMVGDDSPVTGLVISTVTDRVLISYDSGTLLWSLSDS